MTFLGSSESAGNALRWTSSLQRISSSSSASSLSLSLPLSSFSSPLLSRPYRINRPHRMVATPPRVNQLWHPARGISFSPGPTPLATPPIQRPTALGEAPAKAGVSRYHATAIQSTGTQTEEIWSSTVVQQTTASTLGPKTLVEQVEKSTRIKSTVGEAVEKSEAEETKEAESTAASAVEDHPPPALLEYKMADELFYAAKNAPKGTPASFWSYSHYRRKAKDGSSEKVKVHYCRSTHTMERVCKEYFMNERVLGFDLEWVADSTRYDGVKKNVSLIQLASPSRIGLFHVALFPDSEDMVGPSFRSIMENIDVTKVGVWIKGDATKLRRFLGIESQGLIELSNLYKLVVHSRSQEYHLITRKLVPLAKQVQDFLHLPLFKGQDVRSSNWSKALNMEQVLYSASDAYAGVQLYATLNYHRKQLDPCPPHPHFAETNLAIELADGVEVIMPENSDDVLADEENEALDGAPAKKSSKKASPAKKSTTKRLEQPKDSRLEITEDRVTAYKAAHPASRATPAQLRSYYLWYYYDLSPARVAELLRNPPLKQSTVASYIASIAQTESLPIDWERMVEVADIINAKLLWTLYPVVAKNVAPYSGKSPPDSEE